MILTAEQVDEIERQMRGAMHSAIDEYAPKTEIEELIETVRSLRGEDAREELSKARETIRRLNRRCQEAEGVLGDITKHPAVNQSRTGRMSYAVLALAVKQANEKVAEMERHVRADNMAWTDDDLRKLARMILESETYDSERFLFVTLRSVRDLKVPPILEAGSGEPRVV